MSVGATEILFILFVVVIVFGPKRIPEIAKALGRFSTEFKKAKAGIQKETDSLIQEVSAEPTDIPPSPAGPEDTLHAFYEQEASRPPNSEIPVENAEQSMQEERRKDG